MRFPLVQLYVFNRSKPNVVVKDVEGELQWDECDLTGLPPEREPGSMTDHGKIPGGQYDNLPTKFTDMNGNEHLIADIHTLMSSG